MLLKAEGSSWGAKHEDAETHEVASDLRQNYALCFIEKSVGSFHVARWVRDLACQCYGVALIPGPGISTCCRCGQKINK